MIPFTYFKGSDGENSSGFGSVTFANKNTKKNRRQIWINDNKVINPDLIPFIFSARQQNRQAGFPRSPPLAKEPGGF
jgi:hypothetical protein